MRLPQRKWWICGLLLLATMINYMDRQTLANAATRVTKEFSMSQEKYGELEQWFGWSFGAGSLLFGLIADRMSVRWLYPAVLFGWSMAGIVTAWTTNYEQLFWCRVGLGFFEAAHWPCAVKTTFAVLTPGERAMGNSILQSGASVGAMITPPIMLWLMTEEIGTWRYAFEAVGVVGLMWIGLWFWIVRGADFQSSEVTAAKASPVEPLWKVMTGGKFVAVALLIVGAQTCWALFRVWLPKFLQEGRGYSEVAALGFNSAYFIATDIGCLLAGMLALWLVKNRAMTSHRAKR
ncbi:MAG: hypothetical protein JWO08_3608, partial [Verrucomicrobiaceae bacterium]|nr:hypothetical protein [Verrucomicrobiaceae bacterium]